VSTSHCLCRLRAHSLSPILPPFSSPSSPLSRPPESSSPGSATAGGERWRPERMTSLDVPLPKIFELLLGKGDRLPTPIESIVVLLPLSPPSHPWILLIAQTGTGGRRRPSSSAPPIKATSAKSRVRSPTLYTSPPSVISLPFSGASFLVPPSLARSGRALRV
jgi:hypothetical protein